MPGWMSPLHEPGLPIPSRDGHNTTIFRTGTHTTLSIVNLHTQELVEVELTANEARALAIQALSAANECAAIEATGVRP